MEPKLQPPGAGLPLPQKLLLRYFIGPFQSKRTPWDVSRSRYEKLTAKIIKAAEGVPVEKRKTKILVNPIIGLEDSSRYWSVDMLLEHLMIVGKNMEGIILSLSTGVKPNVVADTAKVKPTAASSENSPQNILFEFKAFAPTLLQRLDSNMKNKDSDTTLEHPWFGECTARQWYFVLAAHQGIHWQQLKQIIQKL
jgi:hypothetical protein